MGDASSFGDEEIVDKSISNLVFAISLTTTRSSSS